MRIFRHLMIRYDYDSGGVWFNYYHFITILIDVKKKKLLSFFCVLFFKHSTAYLNILTWRSMELCSGLEPASSVHSRNFPTDVGMKEWDPGYKWLSFIYRLSGLSLETWWEIQRSCCSSTLTVSDWDASWMPLLRVFQPRPTRRSPRVRSRTC